MHAIRPQPAAASVARARALLIGATLLWGMSFPLTRGIELAQRMHVPPMPDAALAAANMALRFGLAALVLLPFFGAGLRNVTRREWSQAIVLGLLACAGLYLQTLGLIWTDASVAAFLTQLYTLIVPLIVAVRDRRLPTARTFVACGLVLAGAMLLSPGIRQHFRPGWGEIIIVLGTGFIAAQIVCLERPVYAENRAGVVTLLMFTIITLVSLVLAPLAGGTVGGIPSTCAGPAVWEMMAALVLFCTALSFFIMNQWQRWVSATEAGLIYCLEPIVATVVCSFLPGWISALAGVNYPNEALTWNLFAGGSLIVAATILVVTQKRTASG